MTTTRKYLKQQDLEIGIDYGIEWGLPQGSLHVIEELGNGEYRVCLVTYYDGVAHNHCGNAKEINKWLKSFDWMYR